MRKILYSPGFGAGWTTWNSGEVAKYMVDYKPIIDFIEAGGSFKDEETKGITDNTLEEVHPLLRQLYTDCKEKFGSDYVCTLGADDLRVATVNGRVRIHEYDGSERLEEEDSYDGWM